MILRQTHTSQELVRSVIGPSVIPLVNEIKVFKFLNVSCSLGTVITSSEI